MTRKSRPALAVVLGFIGFIVIVAVRSHPADTSSRFPDQYRLAGLIQTQQTTTEGLRRQVDQLHRQVDALEKAGVTRAQGAQGQANLLSQDQASAGLTAVRGPGMRVSLNDSLLEQAPSGNVNDLVIHSQDVQAVVNALWRAGAEAIAINGQRLIATSAVLCVGNTLLLNGTVQSPPYVTTAIGASRDRFDADPLVRTLRSDAATFGLRMTVERLDAVTIPAFTGGTALQFARPA